jgi:hypothetical protein
MNYKIISTVMCLSIAFVLAACSSKGYFERLFEVELCDNSAELVNVSCRVMYEASGFRIEKIHTEAGRDQVAFYNKTTSQNLLIPDCKLKGFNVVNDTTSIICYFHEENVASGRKLSASETLDYVLLNNETAQIIRNESIIIGGIDSELIRVESDSKHIYCDEGKCIEVISGKTPHYEIIIALPNRKIMEIVIVDNYRFGLLSFDGESYYIGEVSGGQVLSEKVINASYDLSYTRGELVATEVNNKTDLINSFIFDYERFDEVSGLTWGESNAEGRLAWAAFYYWGGFSYLTNVANVSIGLQIKQRLHQEVSLAFLEGTSIEKRILSKRYSLNRRPLLFMMHVGRMLTSLELINRYTSYNVSKYIEDLEELMISGDFIEEFDETRRLNDPDYFGENLHAGWFYFNKGVDFWADGLPIPFNYVSAICTENHTSLLLEERCYESISYLEEEVVNAKGKKWRYWPGELANIGFSESSGVSINTPNWSGNKNAIAHSSYLSMDAIALIKRSQRVDVVELIVSMIADSKLKLDIVPYLDDESMTAVCESSAIKNIKYLDNIMGYGAYDFYQKAIKVYALSRCGQLVPHFTHKLSV